MEYSKYIDFEEGKKYLDADLLIFLKRFRNIDLLEGIQNIERSLSKSNWTDLRRTAHSLKSISAYVGALTLKLHCENLQILCQDESVSEAKIIQCTESLIKHAQELKDFLNDYLSENCDALSTLSKKEISMFEESAPKSHNQKYIIRKLIPPVTRILENNTSPVYEEDELEIYKEINMQWRCNLF